MLNVYGQPDCGPCTVVTGKLKREGVLFDYIDLSRPENEHHIARLKATGVRMQTPIVETPTDVFSGFEPKKLADAVAEVRALQAAQQVPAMTGPDRSLA